MRSALVAVGRVRKPHGYKGELKVTLEADHVNDFAESKFVFVGRDPNTALPYELLTLRGLDPIVQLAGFESKEQCAVLAGQIIYLRDDDVTQREDPNEIAPDQEDYKRFIGFAVIDDDIGEVGQISDVTATPHQILAEVVHDERKHLVPLNQDLIRGIDFTQKIVFMELPEGLLEL